MNAMGATFRNLFEQCLVFNATTMNLSARSLEEYNVLRRKREAGNPPTLFGGEHGNLRANRSGNTRYEDVSERTHSACLTSIWRPLEQREMD